MDFVHKVFDFTNKFPDLSLLWQYKRISQTFIPSPWTIFVFPWLFPDRDNPEHVLSSFTTGWKSIRYRVNVGTIYKLLNLLSECWPICHWISSAIRIEFNKNLNDKEPQQLKCQITESDWRSFHKSLVQNWGKLTRYVDSIGNPTRRTRWVCCETIVQTISHCLLYLTANWAAGILKHT